MAAALAEVVEAVVLRSDRRVLDQPSLRLDPGTVTLLLGPNGAGKTTLLRALAGVQPLHGGRVSINGRDPRRERAARAQLALVPQEVALYPRLTVRENLQVFAEFGGVSRRDAPIADTLRRTALTDHADRLVSTLSGGLQRRVNIACALVTLPLVLLLDEPTVGLDFAARRAVLASLRDLATSAGMAVLMTTHDLDEAEIIVDRVALLRDGRLLVTESPAGLLARAFPEACRRIDLMLDTPPDAAFAQSLLDRGLSPLVEGVHWRGFLSADAAEHLVADLDDQQVRDLHLHRPGLADAYAALLDLSVAA